MMYWREMFRAAASSSMAIDSASQSAAIMFLQEFKQAFIVAAFFLIQPIL